MPLLLSTNGYPFSADCRLLVNCHVLLFNVAEIVDEALDYLVSSSRTVYSVCCIHNTLIHKIIALLFVSFVDSD